MNELNSKTSNNNLKQIGTGFLLAAFCLQMFSFTATAQLVNDKNAAKQNDEMISEATIDERFVVHNAPYKIAPDLEEKTDEVFHNLRGDETQRVIIQLKSEASLNLITSDTISDADQKETFAGEAVKNKEKTETLINDLAQVGGKVKKSLNNLGLVSAELPLSKVRELVKSDTVAYVSPDRGVQSFGFVEQVIGANQGDGRSELPGFESLNGSGVGIAVLDSGIDTAHNSIKAAGARPSVVFSKTYTSVPAGKDYYGHGTHVASLLAGDQVFKNDAYTGIAYESKIINLAVLDKYGKGSTSNVIAAIDWVIANKTTHNIRVINMSLGTPPKDSYTTDPLCVAARRAYNAGIVVVASAGNFGKDLYGKKIYGGINSPGIEPSVITVGATNTYGTDTRYDDTVATFSSNGPTRGYKTVNGVKKYDNLIKPDIVAPGNKLIAAVSPSSALQSTSIIKLMPSLNAGGTGNDQMMYMSGTSMATPLVSGAVAMILEARPDLTPALVKALLMYSAQPIRNTSTLEQGAGIVNVEGAIEIVGKLKPNVTTFAHGTPMLTAPLDGHDDIAGSGLVYWGKGMVTNYGLLYGDALMANWQGMYSNGVLVSDGTKMSGTTLIRSATVLSNVNLYQGAIKINSNGVLISDGTLFMSSNTMSNGSTLGQGVLVSDGVLISDGVLVSDGLAMSAAALAGDDTSCMQPAP